MQIKMQNLEKVLSGATKILEGLTSQTIRVGFKDAGLSKIAFYNNYGSYNVLAGRENPARPFGNQTFEGSHGEAIAQYVGDCVADLINSKRRGAAAATSTLKKIARFAKEEMKTTILEQNFVPNAEATVKKKGHSTILIGKFPELYDNVEGWVE